MKNETAYKRRRRVAGGADRYGRFRDGRQLTQDVIAGHLIWSTLEKPKANS